MLKRLSAMQPSLLTYRHHRGVQLTAAGRKAVLDIIRRHRLLETFLHRILGLPWDQVHKEAESLEHHVSVRVTDALEELLQHPKTDPHGEPIPARDGSLPSPTFKNRLSMVPIGETVKIAAVHPPLNWTLCFTAAGLNPKNRNTASDRLRE